jgi:hypothetical protein
MKKIPFFFITIFLLSNLTYCKKDKSDCGCNSETVDTYNDVKGKLSYDSSKNKYFIYTNAADQYRLNYICDTTIANFHDLYGDGIGPNTVIFSADVKEFCIPDTVGYMTKPQNIRVSKISKY